MLLTATLGSALHSIPTARDGLCTLLINTTSQQNELEATQTKNSLAVTNINKPDPTKGENITYNAGQIVGV